MRILLIGKTGQLGGSILADPQEHHIIAPDRNVLDLESEESCNRVISEFSPDIVINTAAFHNVPQCEKEPLRAFAVNCVAVHNLAVACKKKDVRLVTFSTDYVFDGEKRTPYKEDDRTGPLQMYGIARLAGENAVFAAAPEHAIIVRTCGLYGLTGAASKGGNFVDKRIVDAQSRTELQMGCDQVVTPTYTGDLAHAVLSLIEHPKCAGGIYHLANEGECSWFEFTRAIYELMNIEMKLLPVDRQGMSGAMRRPLYSVLENTKARKLGISMPHWRGALKRYLSCKYILS